MALYYSIGGYISAIDLKHLSLFYTVWSNKSFGCNSSLASDELVGVTLACNSSVASDELSDRSKEIRQLQLPNLNTDTTTGFLAASFTRCRAARRRHDCKERCACAKACTPLLEYRRPTDPPDPHLI